LVINTVSKSEEVFTSSESVEVVVSVSLSLVKGEELGILSESVDGLNILVDIRFGVHISPKGFSVCGVLTTTIGLFVTVVDNWDTNGAHSESEGSLEGFVTAACR